MDDDTHQTIEPKTIENPTTNAESNDCSNGAASAVDRATSNTINCDNDNQPLCSLTDKTDENCGHRNKRKHKSKCGEKTDSTSTIKSFFSNELNDSLADFEVPNKIAKRMPKVPTTKVVKKTRSRQKKRQPDIRKALSKDDATSSNDYSHLPEEAQLELALAISKAESMNVRDASSDSKSVDVDVFAFNPTSLKSSGSSSNIGDRLNFFNMNRKAKARFKWNSKCTQLTRRNDDAQKLKIRDKIDEILLNTIIVESNQAERLKSDEHIDSIDYTPHQIYSRRLQRICISERILFELNNCDQNTNSTLCTYYTNNLVEATDRGAETLLKDWSKIPGRDSIYDGRLAASTNNPIETDTVMTVIASSPEYDIQTESSSSEIDADKHDDQYTDTAGCSRSSPSNQMASVANENDDGDDDDEDRTLIMDSSDIQSKFDAINSNIRLSQKFCDNFLASDFTCQAATTLRAPSPDLFDDDDDEYFNGNDAIISNESGKVFSHCTNRPLRNFN